MVTRTSVEARGWRLVGVLDAHKLGQKVQRFVGRLRETDAEFADPALRRKQKETRFYWLLPSLT